MKNIKQNDFMFEHLNPDFDIKDYQINELVKISQRIKYTGNRIKKNDKHLDKSFLKAIKSIEDESMDITQNYTCAPIIGLSLADEYGENAREYFHILCKFNKQYNTVKCDKEYSKYLKAESEFMSMVPFYYLYAEGIIDEFNTLINKKSKASKS